MSNLIEILLPLIAILIVPLTMLVMLTVGRRTARQRGVEVPAPWPTVLAIAVQAGLILAVYFSARMALVPTYIPGNTLSLLFVILGGQYLWFVPGRRALTEQDLQIRNQSEAPPGVEDVRVASLRARRTCDYVPRGMRYLPWILSGIGILVYLRQGLLPGLSFGSRLAAAGFVVMALFELALYSWWLSHEVKAPQNLTAHSSPELVSEWESLRRFRVRLVFMFHTILPIFFIAIAILALEAFRGTISGATVGMIGGGGGAFLGLLGGIGGVLADVRRRRLDVMRALDNE